MILKSKYVILIIFLFSLLCVSPVFAGGNNTTNEYIINNTVTVSDDTVYALEDGHFNTSFSDGGNGYCLEYGEQEAEEGDRFYVVNTSYAMSNNNEDVSDYLKTYFIRYYNHAMRDKIVAQHMIWHFTDGFDGWRLNYTIIDDVKGNPLRLPDTGYVKWNSTHYLFFEFKVLLSPFEHHQNYWWYKIWFNTTLPFVNNTNNTDNSNFTVNNIVNTTYKNETIKNNVINVYEKNIIIKNIKTNKVNEKDNILKYYHTGNPIKILIIILIISTLYIIGTYIIQNEIIRRKK